MQSQCFSQETFSFFGVCSIVISMAHVVSKIYSKYRLLNEHFVINYLLL